MGFCEEINCKILKKFLLWRTKAKLCNLFAKITKAGSRTASRRDAISITVDFSLRTVKRSPKFLNRVSPFSSPPGAYGSGRGRKGSLSIFLFLRIILSVGFTHG